MNSQVKYGLRNASDLLNRIRIRHKRQNQEENQYTPTDKTFFQEDSISFYQHHINKHSKKIAQTSPIQKNNDIQHLSIIQDIEKQQNSFCERLVIQKLQQTLKIYEEDLQKLNDNKCFLQDKIQFLIQKIRKLKEIQINNKILVQQNQKSQNYLTVLVKSYHESMTQAFKSQISSQQYFNLMRSRIRTLLKSMNGDRYYASFAQEWNWHVQLLMTNKRLINQMINEQNEKVINEKDTKYKKTNVNSKKMVFQGEQFLTPDEPKPKKKLSQSQKASLLGDLKSFARNFKFPNN